MEASRVTLSESLGPEVLGPDQAQSDRAIQYIDAIIDELYNPFRGGVGYGTERAIFMEPPHVPHRENDAEHSWSIALTVKVLWSQREELGLYFPDDFDIDKAIYLAIIHDIPEIWSGDVDATTEDLSRIKEKSASDKAAIFIMERQLPFMKAVADDLREYEEKDTFEAQFVSDIDKIFATRVICVDGGKKWIQQRVSREFMCERMRGKLRTVNGHALFDALERDLDNRPELFPPADRSGELLPVSFTGQGSLF